MLSTMSRAATDISRSNPKLWSHSFAQVTAQHTRSLLLCAHRSSTHAAAWLCICMLTAACLLSLPAPAFRRCVGWRLLHMRDVRRKIRPARTCTSASSAASPSGLKRPPVRHQSTTGDKNPDVRSDTMADAPHDHSSSIPQQPAAGGTQPGHAEPEKSHCSALCLIPERSVWRQLQEVRCFKDKVNICLAQHMACLFFISWLHPRRSGSHLCCEASPCLCGVQGFVRWPPHANLLYPFLEDSGSTFEAAAATAASALQDVKPFQVAVTGIASSFTGCMVCPVQGQPRQITSH